MEVILLEKLCFKCGISKSIEKFHAHKKMKDGRLNKCSACTVEDVRQWRQKKGIKKDSTDRYARDIELGKRTRKRQLKVNGVYLRMPPEQQLINRRLSSLKYAHLRKCNIKNQNIDELSKLAFDEAISLCRLRNKLTNTVWTLDHIVPINHKLACGLHNAFNFQVVPDKWNYKKRHYNMNIFVAFDEHTPEWAI